MHVLDPSDPPPHAPIFDPVPPEAGLFNLIRQVSHPASLHSIMLKTLHIFVTCHVLMAYTRGHHSVSWSVNQPWWLRFCGANFYLVWKHDHLAVKSQAYEDSIEASKAERAAIAAASPPSKKKK